MKPGEPRRLVEEDGGQPGALPEAQAMGKLLSQLPAVPDSPAREQVWRQSVWRRLEEGESRRSAGRWLVLVPMAAAAALVVVLWRPALHVTGPDRPSVAAVAPSRIELATGRLLARSPSHDWRKAAAGDGLDPTSELRTEEGGRARLDVAGIATVLLQPKSGLALASTVRTTRLALSGGGLVAHVSKRPPDSPFLVELHGYRVVVVGTIFSVSEGPEASVQVSVSEGVVRVEGPTGGSWRVRAGESWDSATPERLGVDTIASADRELVTDPMAVLALPKPAAPPVLPPVSSGQSEPGTVRPERSRGANPERARSSTSLGPNGALSVRLSTPTVAPVPAPALPPTPTATPAPTSTPTVASPPAPDLYAQAHALSARGDYAGAAALLQQVADRHAAHADLALYELGRLEQRELGDPKGALAAFNRYRASYPEGSLAQEVALSVIETELSRTELEPAFAEMTQFLKAYPDSERAGEVHLLKGNVLRQRGDCAAALAEYGQSRHGASADDALYFTAWCQRQLGHSGAAEASLREYLKAFPAGGHVREAHTALGSP